MSLCGPGIIGYVTFDVEQATGEYGAGVQDILLDWAMPALAAAESSISFALVLPPHLPAHHS